MFIVALLEARLRSTPGSGAVVDDGGDDGTGGISNREAITGESLLSTHDEYPIGVSDEYTSTDDLQMPFAIDPILESLHPDSHVSSSNDSLMSNVWNTQLIGLDQYEQLPDSTIMEDL